MAPLEAKQRLEERVMTSAAMMDHEEHHHRSHHSTATMAKEAQESLRSNYNENTNNSSYAVTKAMSNEMDISPTPSSFSSEEDEIQATSKRSSRARGVTNDYSDYNNSSHHDESHFSSSHNNNSSNNLRRRIRSRSAPAAGSHRRRRFRSHRHNRRNRKRLVEQHFKIDKDNMALLPGVPVHDDDLARDLHDFFNLIVLVPIVVLNVLNWDWDTIFYGTMAHSNSISNHVHNHNHININAHHAMNTSGTTSRNNPSSAAEDVPFVHAWTGEYFEYFFWTTVAYFLLDLIWVCLIPKCVKSPSTIIQHHLAVFAYLVLPYFIPKVRFLMVSLLFCVLLLLLLLLYYTRGRSNRNIPSIVGSLLTCALFSFISFIIHTISSIGSADECRVKHLVLDCSSSL